jgi:hypothetical protein
LATARTWIQPQRSITTVPEVLRLAGLEREAQRAELIEPRGLVEQRLGAQRVLAGPQRADAEAAGRVGHVRGR